MFPYHLLLIYNVLSILYTNLSRCRSRGLAKQNPVKFASTIPMHASLFDDGCIHILNFHTISSLHTNEPTDMSHHTKRDSIHLMISMNFFLN